MFLLFFFFLQSNVNFVRQWKCTICQKVLSSKVQLKLHSKMHTEGWNVVSYVDDDNSPKEFVASALPSITLDVRIDSDSSVSEKVLMDAFAEKKSIDQADVSM